MPRWLTSEVARSLEGPWGGSVETLVFGPDRGPEQIVERVGAACVDTCDAELVDGFLYTVSVGCVFGCVLADGRRVVLKAYQPRWTLPFLEAVRDVQRSVHRQGGFPCPEPLGEVVTVDGTVFVAERELPDPGVHAVDAAWAGVSAAGLAELIDRCRGLEAPGLALHPLRDPSEGLFPEPHSPIFDFEATAAGAEWIDELARRALAITAADDSPDVIAHTDWAWRNVRIDHRGIVAVYDWDSLALVKECIAVASAAVTWCKTGEPDDHTPTADEIDEYIEAYDAARLAAPSASLRRLSRAAAVRSMAYTARCEHALDPSEERWTSTRNRLRADAESLLRPVSPS
ncbi:MAG TPA: phosphotransferase [Acidimicrobiales bacterium]|nr:phosphotransferase [Acidimicrobiales bacterium]